MTLDIPTLLASCARRVLRGGREMKALVTVLILAAIMILTGPRIADA